MSFDRAGGVAIRAPEATLGARKSNHQVELGDVLGSQQASCSGGGTVQAGVIGGGDALGYVTRIDH